MIKKKIWGEKDKYMWEVQNSNLYLNEDKKVLYFLVPFIEDKRNNQIKNYGDYDLEFCEGDNITSMWNVSHAYTKEELTKILKEMR